MGGAQMKAEDMGRTYSLADEDDLCEPCNKKVRNDGLQYDMCIKSFHPKCVGVSDSKYNLMSKLGDSSL